MSSGPSAAVMPASPRAALLDTAAMTALLLSYIWGWSGNFAGDSLVIVAGYLGIGAFGHMRRGESLRTLGIRLDNWRPAMLEVLRWMTLPLLIALTIGAAMDSWHFPSWGEWVGGLTWQIIWGTAQQYGLLCFFYRRQRELLVNPVAAGVAAAALFSLFHLPNAFLMAVTLIAGYVACAIYQRVPNLFVMGAMHALTSFILNSTLPLSLTYAFKVGPGYYAWGG